jgi:Mrp family chromosome partitioning ATPase
MASHREAPQAPWGVVEAFYPGLHVLAVAPGSRFEQRLIDGPDFKFALSQLQQSGYRTIIVDCPQVLGAADANVISDSADGVLLCALARRSRGDDLRRAARQLEPANIIGVALLDG